MLEVIFLFVLALIWILFASIQDEMTTEIANWLNFSLIIFALGFRFFYSLFAENFMFFYQGLFGLAVFFVLGNLLYKGRMFAGGDAKLFISLGAVVPVYATFSDNINYFFLFLIIFFIVGAVYSLGRSFAVCIKNFGRFKKEFKRQFKERNKIVNIAMLAAVVIGISSLFVDSVLFYFAIFIFITPYFYLYAKAVDEAAMIKNVPPSGLMEGDWLYTDTKVGNKVIKATWDGLSTGEILLLKKHKKKVWIRRGMPFTWVFLFSIIIYFGFVFFGSRYSFW